MTYVDKNGNHMRIKDGEVKHIDSGKTKSHGEPFANTNDDETHHNPGNTGLNQKENEKKSVTRHHNQIKNGKNSTMDGYEWKYEPVPTDENGVPLLPKDFDKLLITSTSKKNEKIDANQNEIDTGEHIKEEQGDDSSSDIQKPPGFHGSHPYYGGPDKNYLYFEYYENQTNEGQGIFRRPGVDAKWVWKKFGSKWVRVEPMEGDEARHEIKEAIDDGESDSDSSQSSVAKTTWTPEASRGTSMKGWTFSVVFTVSVASIET